MIINSKEIELFKNLSQFDLGGVYFDFHNDFVCTKISLMDNSLLFLFKEIIEGYIISFRFDNITLVGFEFDNFPEFKNLTIDNIYRGRFEKNGKLLEFNSDEKSYFYLEFVEGVNLELWCENIEVDKTI